MIQATCCSRRSFVLGAASLLSGCAVSMPPVEVPAQSITSVHVKKADRVMRLSVGETVVRSYDIALGFNPIGHKLRRGDGRTPEGRYRIDRRNPRSAFHLSLGISFPSRDDIARARRAGRDPGDNIFIHGTPNGRTAPMPGDWTAGCIAVSNPEMEEIWALVPLGCPILIEA